MTSMGNVFIVKNGILKKAKTILNVFLNIIGNAGGYLGLFLGYALLNVPKLIQDAYDWVKNRFKNKNAKAITIVHSDVETGRE